MSKLKFYDGTKSASLPDRNLAFPPPPHTRKKRFISLPNTSKAIELLTN